MLTLTLLAADAAYIALAMPGRIADAYQGLERAGGSFGELRLAAARRDLTRARAGAEGAWTLTSHPAYRIAEMIPRLGGNARAVAAASEAIVLSADAGLAAVDGIEALGADDRGDLVTALYSRGRVNFAGIHEIAPFAARAETLLGHAAATLEGAPEPSIALIRDRMAVARERVTAAAATAAKMHALIEALPDMAGSSERRRYLLAFQTNSEGRGGGGVIGAYGILTARAGRVRLSHLGPVGELLDRRVRVTDAPEWFEDQYGFAGALTDLRQVNLSPHFPATAPVLIDMYRQVTGTRVDGVIAMDPLALASLTRATGPITGRGWGMEVGPDNAATVLLHDAYLRFETEAAQQSYLESVMGAFWRQVTEQDLDGAVLAEALADAVAGRHFQVYGQMEADALRTLQADGSIDDGQPNLLMVFHNHLASNKTDYFLERTVNTTLRLRDDGSAAVRMKVVLDNGAPAGPPSDLLGHGSEGYEPGSNTMHLTVVGPEGAVVRSPDDALVGRELRFPTASSIVDLLPGRRRVLSFAFEIPDAVDLGADAASLTYRLVPQARSTPDRYSFTIVPPPGYEARSEGAQRAGGEVVFSGVLDRPMTVGAGFARVRDAVVQ